MISVIVPIYQAERDLRRCLDSILAQTYSDFELLLIDDGSRDQSGTICDEYQQKDSRIHTYHKQNEGVSSARNMGIEKAQGEYVIQIDSDDWVEPTMLEELYAEAIKQNADMVICDFFIGLGENQVYHQQKPSLLEPKTVRKELFQHLHGGCWNKLIKKECFQRKVRFEESISLCEDKLFICETLKNVTKVAYLNKAFYHYEQNDDASSLSKGQYTEEHYQQRLHICNLFKERIHWDNEEEAKTMETSLAKLMIEGAFKYSRFSSKTFKEKFHDYRGSIFQMKTEPLHIRILWYLSCIGFYRMSFQTENRLVQFKRLFK